MKTIGRMTIHTYSFFMQLAQPLLPLFLSARKRRGKEDDVRHREKLGYASQPRPEGPLIWMHAASVGEVNAILPLCNKLLERDFEILLTTGTVTSAQVASEQIAPMRAIRHQYAPLDAPSIITRFLEHWHPGLVLFAESEIWPVTLRALQARSIPVAIVNGRMSDRSFRRWRMLRGLTPPLFSCIDHVLVRTEEDLLRFQALGSSKISITGNLKYDAPAPQVGKKALAQFKAACHDRPLLLAASTHKGEEEHIIAAHKALTEGHPNLLTCIVPRHPQRGAEISHIADKANLCAQQRSQSPAPTKRCEIYIADTLGELGLFYRLAPFAFIGGSLISVGGHNPIEAVRLNCAVLHGPHIFNFKEIYGVLGTGNASQEILNTGDLIQKADILLKEPVQCARLASQAHKALNTLTGAMERTLEALEPSLAKLEKRAGQIINHPGHTAA